MQPERQRRRRVTDQGGLADPPRVDEHLEALAYADEHDAVHERLAAVLVDVGRCQVPEQALEASLGGVEPRHPRVLPCGAAHGEQQHRSSEARTDHAAQGPWRQHNRRGGHCTWLRCARRVGAPMQPQSLGERPPVHQLARPPARLPRRHVPPGRCRHLGGRGLQGVPAGGLPDAPGRQLVVLALPGRALQRRGRELHGVHAMPCR
mmetsp:Transcript_21164/g.60077  ORF Transcript_21164/g.60077 Transcript_21164/m.60077 type:complete len:206 (-) Transcript_21164:678-1295(-)